MRFRYTICIEVLADTYETANDTLDQLEDYLQRLRESNPTIMLITLEDEEELFDDEDEE